MTFADQPWEVRRGVLGDIAEGEFEKRYPKGWTRIGHNRPPVNMASIHPHERHRPDYMVSGRYIEVMGVGQEQVLKLKLDKLEALRFWQLLMPVNFWVWDSYNERVHEFTLDDIEALLPLVAIKRFPEGTPYYALPVGRIPRGVPPSAQAA